MTEVEAVQVITSSGRQPVEVEFVKRTTQSLRIMKCQSLPPEGYPPPKEDSKRAYDPKEKFLIVVWDAEIGAFRCIPIEGLVRVRRAGSDWEAVERLDNCSVS